jgi:hypothetical protein
MSLIVSTHGIYRGVKIGVSKNGKEWFALLFSCPENYSGASISAESFPRPNLMIFPNEGLDISSFEENKKYNLSISCPKKSNASGNVNLSLIAFAKI